MDRRTLTKIGLAGFALSGLVLPSMAAEDLKLKYSDRPDVKAFINDVSKRRALDPEWVAEVINSATYQPKIERLMTPKKPKPGTKSLMRDWDRYRDMFLGTYRINLGAEFWKNNKELLDRAHKEFGVDPAVIVGIIGVETRYGENTGSWKILDALVTLSFDYRRRSDFFKKELEEFLVFLQQNGLHHLQVQGSYAGAIGMPQFMPSSIKRFGVDYDGDGKVDLSNSVADTIGSVANYLAKNGWQEGQPMILDAYISPKNAVTYGSGKTARFELGKLLDAGVKLRDPNLVVDPKTKVFVVDLPFYPSNSTTTDHIYKLGTKNFATVLRYNSQYFYATAVAELASAIALKLGEQGLIS